MYSHSTFTEFKLTWQGGKMCPYNLREDFYNSCHLLLSTFYFTICAVEHRAFNFLKCGKQSKFKRWPSLLPPTVKTIMQHVFGPAFASAPTIISLLFFYIYLLQHLLSTVTGIPSRSNASASK